MTFVGILPIPQKSYINKILILSYLVGRRLHHFDYYTPCVASRGLASRIVPLHRQWNKQNLI